MMDTFKTNQPTVTEQAKLYICNFNLQWNIINENLIGKKFNSSC